jgi:hypothetical protein
MKILTDDPDWAPELYEARALALALVRKHGRWQRNAATFLIAERNRLTVTYYPHRSPLLLTIDASGESAQPFARVLSIEWNDGVAWRLAIETYHQGRWQSRLKAMVQPRPWLQRWRAMATFTGSLPRQQAGASESKRLLLEPEKP